MYQFTDHKNEYIMRPVQLFFLESLDEYSEPMIMLQGDIFDDQGAITMDVEFPRVVTITRLRSVYVIKEWTRIEVLRRVVPVRCIDTSAEMTLYSSCFPQLKILRRNTNLVIGNY